jgi:hypothetical protein
MPPPRSDLREERRTASWVNANQQHAAIIFDRITVRKIGQSRGRKHLIDSSRRRTLNRTESWNSR